MDVPAAAAWRRLRNWSRSRPITSCRCWAQSESVQSVPSFLGVSVGGQGQSVLNVPDGGPINFDVHVGTDRIDLLCDGPDWRRRGRLGCGRCWSCWDCWGCWRRRSRLGFGRRDFSKSDHLLVADGVDHRRLPVGMTLSSSFQGCEVRDNVDTSLISNGRPRNRFGGRSK